MIVPRAVIPPLALLVALLTVAVAFYQGIGRAPSAFLGEGDLVLLGPADGAIPGRSEVDASLVPAMRELPGVRTVSVETFAITTVGGRSAFVRGVDFAPFVEIERAWLVDGRWPEVSGEAAVGAGFARLHEAEVGQRLLVPAAFARVATPLRVVGVFDDAGAVRDEILVGLTDGRRLANLSSSSAHLIRVDVESPEAFYRIVDSRAPRFTYSDVRISSSEVVVGEPVVLTANLTNWGRLAGAKVAEVRTGHEVLAERRYEVPPQTTVPVELSFRLGISGIASVTLNPTFNVTVRSPPFSIVAAPASVAAGEPFALEVHDAEGRPAPGATLRAGQASATTGPDGRATLALDRLGPQHVDVVVDGHVEASARIHAYAPDDEDRARIVLERVDLEGAPFGEEDPVRVVAVLQNLGGAVGSATPEVALDGEPVGATPMPVPPGETVRLPINLGVLAVGSHTVLVEGIERTIHVYPGRDPRVAVFLEHVAEGGPPAPESPAVERAGAYVRAVVGSVELAVLALSLATGALCAMGAWAVLARHLGEQRAALGVLKALGARDADVLGIAMREAALASTAAAGLGIASGALLAKLVDAAGWVRAFGHAVRPPLDVEVFLMTLVGAGLVISILARQVVAGLLRAPVDELMRGRGAWKPPPPWLAELDAGGRP